MPTNDFLPFGTAAGANVTDQATWNGLAARTAGFSAGVASSAQVNKALRQAGFIAAAVAQFTADMQAGNVADDGIIANFETQLKNAILAQAATAFTGSNRSFGGTGRQSLPGGFIIQWVNVTTSTSADTVASWQIAFPTVFFGAIATPNNSGASFPTYFYDASVGNGLTGVKVNAYSTAPARVSNSFTVFGFGA